MIYKNVGLSRFSLILHNLGIKLTHDIFFTDMSWINLYGFMLTVFFEEKILLAHKMH